VKAVPPGGITVIKIGGALATVPRALARVSAVVSTASTEHRLVIVPGGGPFADAVRSFDSRFGLSADAAHWMAILAMDQYAYVLADQLENAVVVDQPAEVPAAVAQGKVPVLAPFRWMRSADVLPHSWEVTSDSIAAFVAGALGALRLILIKAATEANAVDDYFRTALPSGMPWMILEWDRVSELSGHLNESTADA
jgi:5-(aminomethyl)-3-furanmethanol phosphate kinase